VDLTAPFRGPKVRLKKILEKSNIYKNSQNAIKNKKLLNYLQKKGVVMRIDGKMHYSRLRDLTIFVMRKTKILKNS
jgi:hypothetical protein